MRVLPTPGLRVFAVEDRAVQLDWSGGTAGAVRAAGPGGIEAGAEAGAGPGAIVVDGLAAATDVELTVQRPGRRSATLALRTLDSPPGEELARVSTISDLHVGERGFGYFKTIRERLEPDVPTYSERATEAAFAEAAAWRAQLMVVKGDITNRGEIDEWSRAGRVLATAPLPAVVVPGNHDVNRLRAIDPADALGAGGPPVASPLAVRDLPGLRVVAVDSTVVDRHEGRVSHLQDEVADALADAARAGCAALVCLHHQPHWVRLPATWPPGVPREESDQFLDRLGQANPRTVVTSGHTHRNRRHQRGPVTATTVGSVKDYPGTWAGYVVHEGGLRQVVRRVARPDVIAWTERSGDCVGGLYRWWTPGPLAARCFTLRWD